VLYSANIAKTYIDTTSPIEEEHAKINETGS
jgi:hypothetical protein